MLNLTARALLGMPPVPKTSQQFRNTARKRGRQIKYTFLENSFFTAQPPMRLLLVGIILIATSVQDVYAISRNNLRTAVSETDNVLA
jgi:hypothetical protein